MSSKPVVSFPEFVELPEEKVEADRAKVVAGELAPIREMLYDSAILLRTTVLAVMRTATIGDRDLAKKVAAAVMAAKGVKEIFITLAEHSSTDTLGGIASTVFQDNLQRIMKYICRKGGVVKRYELLSSRVIQGRWAVQPKRST